jgi:YidC/Oxa1 family membrane protein insertase
MDKKSITGLVLIGAILIGWMLLSQPSAEEIAKRKEQHTVDSIAQYKTDEKLKSGTVEKAEKPVVVAGSPISILRDSTGKVNDSVKSLINKQVYGDFSAAASGDNKIIILENEVMKVSISPKGGRVASVELKNYKT